jgi:formylglycine-generating enzyme required for sulfatase activity
MKKNMNLFTKLIFVMLFGLGMVFQANANNVQISNVSLIGDTVKFDISWENSWRNTATANSTENFDGVWVFVKYRDACDRTSSYPSAYNHAWLVNDTLQHFMSSTASKKMGTTTISGTPRAMGIFIHRRADGTGTFTLSNVKLRWDQAAQGTAGGNWDIRVNAIEMVWIPGGRPFRLGGGEITQNGTNTATFANNNTGLVAYSVNAENTTIPINQVGGVYTYSYGTTGTIPATFPKGYDAFWVMKYEISQGQYVDYLNSLDRQEQINSVYVGAAGLDFNTIGDISISSSYKYVLYTTTSTVPVNRQSIAVPLTPTANLPVVFGCDLNNNGTFNESADGQNISCNFMGYDNNRFIRKYLDWSALRPMTEFEYERICRGPIANVAYQSNELVWGLDGSNAANRTAISSLTNSGASNESMNPDPCVSNGSVIANNTIGGPARVGITHATCTPTPSTRANAGSSFYGVTDMAGNNLDWVWSFGLHPNNTGLIGTYIAREDMGDGDVLTIPPASWTVSSQNMYKGGSWTCPITTWQFFTISMRSSYTTTTSQVGGRGVRTSQ